MFETGENIALALFPLPEHVYIQRPPPSPTDTIKLLPSESTVEPAVQSLRSPGNMPPDFRQWEEAEHPW